MEAQEIEDISVDSVVSFEDERQPLKMDIEKLSMSFQRAGQKMPILVYRIGDNRHVGVFGKHRLEAAKASKQSTIEAVVYPRRPNDNYVTAMRFLDNALHRRRSSKEKAGFISDSFETGMPIERIAEVAFVTVTEVRQVLIEEGKIKPNSEERKQIREKNNSILKRHKELLRAKRQEEKERKQRQKQRDLKAEAKNDWDIDNQNSNTELPIPKIIKPTAPKGRVDPVFDKIREVKQTQQILDENNTVCDKKMELCKKVVVELRKIPEVDLWLRESKKFQLIA